MDEIEKKCRELCQKNKVSPDGLAPAQFQKLPGYPVGADGKVRQWMLWITTAKRDPTVKVDRYAVERKESRNRLNRIIEETTKISKSKYSFYDDGKTS